MVIVTVTVTLKLINFIVFMFFAKNSSAQIPEKALTVKREPSIIPTERHAINFI